eukprot:4746896-Pyramimonas_sp.AAC.1
MRGPSAPEGVPPMEKRGTSDNGPSEPRGGMYETPNRAEEYGAHLVVNREGGSQSRRQPNCP